jgi:transcription elongation factor GreA
MLKKRDDGPVYLTEDGRDKLKSELARLKAALPGYIEEAARTAAYGDRSDNAEYKDAKGRLRRTHYRIAEIEDQLKRVSIIRSGPNASGRVELGSTVVLETGGKQATYYIVGPREADPGEGRVSHVSPLGAALMGRSKGDAVSIQTPKGVKEYRILKIN